MDRIEKITSLIDEVLADPGQHSPEATAYSDVAVPMPKAGLCWRCETHPVGEGSELCPGCRAFLLEDTEVDPSRPDVCGYCDQPVTSSEPGGEHGGFWFPNTAGTPATANAGWWDAPLRPEGTDDTATIEASLAEALATPEGCTAESQLVAHELHGYLTGPQATYPPAVLGYRLTPEQVATVLVLTPEQLQVFARCLAAARFQEVREALGQIWPAFQARMTELITPLMSAFQTFGETITEALMAQQEDMRAARRAAAARRAGGGE